ncbi:hypothetical protein HPP92_012675 [Vanilla planifolia]|uniref:RING-type domain-containing protein n=1 Tax=Vanilla planifolia TaxID=51239 RepID=A0A835QNI2_VANPL|nr:hypothetical protein HPP92_012675 [Vanilla planifolia]
MVSNLPLSDFNRRYSRLRIHRPMSIPPQSALTPGVLMMASALFLLILFFVVLFLYLYIRRRRGPPNFSLSSQILLPSSNSSTAVPLDPGVLKSLPSTFFRSGVDRKVGYGPECTVCISEFADSQLSRFLPGCRHIFHLDCIDTWFLSNSTCPVCRSSVEPQRRRVCCLPRRHKGAGFDNVPLSRIGNRGEFIESFTDKAAHCRCKRRL